MEQANKLEKVFAEWHSKLPHLPAGGREWLATNVWWLVVIGVILSVLGLISIASVLFLAGAGLSLAGAALGGSYGAAAGLAVGGVLLVTTLVSVALYVLELVLLALAINPLKSHKKRGWTLLYYVTLLNLLATVVIDVLSFNVPGLVRGVLWVAVGGYFLFEIREYFGAKKPAHAKKEAAKA